MKRIRLIRITDTAVVISLKCRCIVRNDEYNKIIEIVRMFNAKQISKEETYKSISNILSNGKYNELINDFDRLFS